MSTALPFSALSCAAQTASLEPHAYIVASPLTFPYPFGPQHQEKGSIRAHDLPVCHHCQSIQATSPQALSLVLFPTS